MVEQRAGRRVVFLVFPGVQALDLVGPMEVFHGASQMVDGAYTVEIVGGGSQPVTSSSGLLIQPTVDLAHCSGPIDTLLVAGGLPGVRAAEQDEELISWLQSAARRSRRVGSVCNGALLLARAGVLDGRRATTHWAACEELACRYPQVAVEGDPIFVRDGRVWTSAGVTAGMDLTLALVEDDLGRAVALEIARWLVLFLQRPGGQSQFSAQLVAQRAERRPLRELQAWITDNVAADLRVEVLAERACMSPRHFARAFRQEVGVTPAAYVEMARVEIARQALLDTDASIDAVAARCGFGTPETMRRAFHRRLGVGPANYRARFRLTHDATA
ncbi:GlxA family transcriptional regulator [Nocardia anaemiae]|uniref:GlxA family transcriptional regulator n=1 Tax=Nocardia anaemiae TaxID=263910 RepID=UPI0007A4A4D5|nr:GlxA family transcriptional regulator [Nocardia anaemiae]